ncbi:hypothetical protein SPJ1_2246 [Streptococcus parauberis KRS-02083]|uniref:Uncharacterized protein n=1 Tax=Streptococcus parauberis KRS-02083 TaxID=1207545 RepID=A0ABN0INM4_9STRE|nr:hypothetical protein SPJ1_2246 [Streptococcus parauberis KRS-02083]
MFAAFFHALTYSIAQKIFIFCKKIQKYKFFCFSCDYAGKNNAFMIR